MHPKLTKNWGECFDFALTRKLPQKMLNISLGVSWRGYFPTKTRLMWDSAVRLTELTLYGVAQQHCWESTKK